MKPLHVTLSLLCALALLSSCASGGTNEVASTVEEATALGNAVLPLTATVYGTSYRLSGQIHVDALSPLGSERIHSQRLDAEAGSMVVLTLPVGAYEVTLHEARLFRSEAGGETPVTFTPTLGAVQRVVVSPNSATNVVWWFEAADTLVPLDPCFTNPDALDCASGDLDDDGVANGVECSNPIACIDTDGDGVADVSDMDSDEDTYLDGFDGAPLDACVPNPVAAACTDAHRRAREPSESLRRSP